MLYPIKFTPIFSEVLWGGSKLSRKFKKQVAPSLKIGESWEISAVENSVSIVANGIHKGKDIDQLIRECKQNIVGAKVYELFGEKFPLLIKFIDADSVLSIQVHPNDNLAKSRHNSFGKTEMWYVVEAEPNAELVLGFNKPMSKEEYLKCLSTGQIETILAKYAVKQGDAFYVPAGRVHSIGKGILLAEIQQTSNITYRLFDYNRKDKNGNTRELHTELAIDAIDFNYCENAKIDYSNIVNMQSEISSCQYFTTNLLEIDTSYKTKTNIKESFIIYMCIEGDVTIVYDEDKLDHLSQGETVLIPAGLGKLIITPSPKAKLLEVYI